MKWIKCFFVILFVWLFLFGGKNEIFIRVNQVGYLPHEPKVAIVFSSIKLEKYEFAVIEESTGKRIFGPFRIKEDLGEWGNFRHYYELDFSDLETSGRYVIAIGKKGGKNWRSLPFSIGVDIYNRYVDFLLFYMRQQRCGYNPILDEVCHRFDGRTVYAPIPDGSYIDATGGWHDAGDYLKYLLTSSNTVCRLLITFIENRGKFSDSTDYFGHKVPNGIPDILDEAKWGLDWMLKLHPDEDQLYHQVADDRDHIGFKLPFKDTADYGWGPGSYRVVYFASGKPQGLGKYRNTSTGVANLAGRYAAAMAMAYRVWKDYLKDDAFALRCLKAGIEVYKLGKAKKGSQEGTPCRAPYRYYEKTWADDMEWGASELFRVTGDSIYYWDAVKFSKLAGTVSWMGLDTANHYEYYPFMNMGHYSLYSVSEDQTLKDSLIFYYRHEIEKVLKRARNNPFRVGIPFIWCSNNLAAAFVNQCILYEKMSGNTSYQRLMSAHRDWLLGRNPWGVSQFIGIPDSGGMTPGFPHSAIFLEKGIVIKGGLVDGPVYASIFNSLKGIRLSREDKFSAFQSDYLVYHDDVWDYSTNEPTLDGTAEALFFISHFAR